MGLSLGFALFVSIVCDVCVVRFPCWPLLSLPSFFARSCLVLFLVGREGCAMERFAFRGSGLWKRERNSDLNC
jgi:hypothetical protein